jgi:very-short-patch-repair endonuclease
VKNIINRPEYKELRRKLRNDMPKPEQKLWYYLRNRQIEGIRFRRQCSIGKYIVDFYSFEKKLVIEVDGDSHFLSDELIKKDAVRTKFLENQGIKVLLFMNNDVMKNCEGCIDELLRVLDRI